MRSTQKLFALFVAATLLCSCASISSVDTWRNPALQKARVQRALVVSITKQQSNRSVYEDVLAGELGSRGVGAVASHTIFPGGLKAERAALDQAVKKAGADSVLTVQTVKVQRQTTIQPAFAETYPGYWYPQAFPSWDFYGYYGSMDPYGPAYVSSYDIATIQVNLFDSSTGKLVWAGTFKTSEPEKVVTVAKDLARLVVENLAREGLL